jgi:putative hydrolase of the HAD superfamily
MSMRAVLFDFGGTLYDYRCFARAEAESLAALARWAGVEAAPDALARAQREAMKAVFAGYRERDYYLHKDLFEDALRATLSGLGARADAALLARYRELQWQGHARDFALREGVRETLAELRARGLHLGIVSNIDDDQLDHLLAIAGVREDFDSVLSSERAGACKPAPAIFAEALRRAGCAPHEAVFVGDSLFHDVGGANRVGLRSVLIWHRDDREPPGDGPTPAHVIRRFPELLEIAK